MAVELRHNLYPENLSRVRLDYPDFFQAVVLADEQKQPVLQNFMMLSCHRAIIRLFRYDLRRRGLTFADFADIFSQEGYPFQSEATISLLSRFNGIFFSYLSFAFLEKKLRDEGMMLLSPDETSVFFVHLRHDPQFSKTGAMTMPDGMIIKGKLGSGKVVGFCEYKLAPELNIRNHLQQFKRLNALTERVTSGLLSNNSWMNGVYFDLQGRVPREIAFDRSGFRLIYVIPQQSNANWLKDKEKTCEVTVWEHLLSYSEVIDIGHKLLFGHLTGGVKKRNGPS